MIRLEVDGKIKKIPQSYSEIKVKDFKKIWNVLYKYDLQEEDIVKLQENEQKCAVEVLAELLDIKPNQAHRIDNVKAQQVLALFNNMLDKEKFTDDYEGTSFVYEGESYYFPTLKLEKVSFGEYSEVKQIEALLNKDVAGKFNYIARQMAVMCKRHKEKKEDYDLDEREELFENLTMDIVMKFAFFLSKWNRTYGQNILTYMAKERESEEKLLTS
jgi:hypothetical protein